jgi:hypothetical protein
MAFDPGVATVLDVYDGGFLGSLGHSIALLGPDIDNGEGEVAFGAFIVDGGPGPEGDGTLAVVILEAVEQGSSELDLVGDQVAVYDSLGGRIATAARDGLVVVESGAAPTATPTPTPSDTPEATPAETSTMTLTPTATEPSSPVATPTPEGPPRPRPSPFGIVDVRGDGSLGFDDVLEVLRHRGARETDADWSAHAHADADRDGKVSLSDAVRVLQVLLGL